ncbi:MAG: DUF4442 domain-containing protein [Xanthomonadaceae bacterium]|jgi:acyl-coenzyme A thioesterase PaaI-like protein|nr:DUF4442 domain-containing protein [Xanthomonadaceae bacterium]
MKAFFFRHLLNLWPPFLFTGIHVTKLDKDYRTARVELRMRFWNRNYHGTHFGGSLFAMADPFWALLTIFRLGKDYYIWDKAGTIEFIKPGRGVVYCAFQLEDDVLERIRAATVTGKKYFHWFESEILDSDGDVVAKLRKQIYVRRKPDRQKHIPPA